MNGWIRLGLVISILWFLSGSLYFRSADAQRAQSFMNLSYQTCIDLKTAKHDSNFEPCMDEAWKKSRVFDNGWGSAFLMAALPIPLAWFAALIAFLTIRWIYRGFPKKKPQP